MRKIKKQIDEFTVYSNTEDGFIKKPLNYLQLK